MKIRKNAHFDLASLYKDLDNDWLEWALEKEVGKRVEDEAVKSEDLWQQLLLGCHAFLSVAVEDQNLRILLMDGPANLGWDVFRLMDEQNLMRHLREQLQNMQNKGYL